MIAYLIRSTAVCAGSVKPLNVRLDSLLDLLLTVTLTRAVLIGIKLVYCTYRNYKSTVDDKHTVKRLRIYYNG